VVSGSRNKRLLSATNRFSRKTRLSRKMHKSRKVLIKIGGENGKQFLVSPSLQESIRCY